MDENLEGAWDADELGICFKAEQIPLQAGYRDVHCGKKPEKLLIDEWWRIKYQIIFQCMRINWTIIIINLDFTNNFITGLLIILVINNCKNLWFSILTSQHMLINNYNWVLAKYRKYWHKIINEKENLLYFLKYFQSDI